MALIALAAYKIFPDPAIKDDAYKYYGVFLAISVALSLLYNMIAYRNVAALFRPIPVEAVRREAELGADEGVWTPEPVGGERRPETR
jgi:hypothetical protein